MNKAFIYFVFILFLPNNSMGEENYSMESSKIEYFLDMRLCDMYINSRILALLERTNKKVYEGGDYKAELEDVIYTALSDKKYGDSDLVHFYKANKQINKHRAIGIMGTGLCVYETWMVAHDIAQTILNDIYDRKTLVLYLKLKAISTAEDILSTQRSLISSYGINKQLSRTSFKKASDYLYSRLYANRWLVGLKLPNMN